MINALWLASADVEPLRLEKWLAPYVEKLEAMLRDPGDADDQADGEFPGDAPAPPRHEVGIIAMRDESASVNRPTSRPKKVGKKDSDGKEDAK